MAKSLRDLIEYLLGEVALYGDRGASAEDVLGFIDDFYAAPAQLVGVAEDHGVDRPGDVARRPNLDRRFKSKVWSWLTRHPEVSVGKNREGNDLDLDEMEARCFGAVPASDGDGANVDDNPRDVSLVGNEEPANSQGPLKRTEESPGQNGLRIFVSEERTWLAIAGHKPDTFRIMPLQFALLSIIASKKSVGILHPDLSKLSDQDKRSVPKRTDILQEKGYINKRPIQYKSNRTTLCTLRKFAGAPAAQDGSEDDSMVDFDSLLDKIFKCLKEFNLITRNDLCEKLGMQGRWKRKIMSKSLRKLESIGCVRRVKALSQYSDVNKTRYVALMLVREPTEEDMRLFDDRRSLVPSLEQDDVDELEDAEEEDQPDTAIEEGRKIQQDLDSKPDIEDVGRVIPQWVPGTSLQNLIIRTIDQSGSKGMTAIEITDVTMGVFCRKAIVTTLSHLAESVQYPQPPHLRHLSLVRDATLRGTVYSFLHYSLRNFAALVDSGQASWGAMESSANAAAHRVSLDAEPELDEHGFLVNSVPPGLLKGGNATLRECLKAIEPEGYRVTTQDPIAVQLPDGTYGVRYSSTASARKAMQHGVDIDGVSAERTSGLSSGAKRRRTVEFADQQQADTGESVELASPVPKRRKMEKLDPFAGMSEKERLEAQGFDESWTEYSVLCLERTVPGLYLTPSGRRRPVGKARGRPPRSRIAVFKLPKLKEVGWFMRPEEDEVLPEAGAAAPPEEVRKVGPDPSGRPKRTRRKSERASAADLDYRERSESDLEVVADVQEIAAESTSGMLVPAPPTETVEQPDQPPRRKRGRPPKKRQKVVRDDSAEVAAARNEEVQPEDIVQDSTTQQPRPSDHIAEVEPASEPMQVDKHDQQVVQTDDAFREERNADSTVPRQDTEAVDENVRISTEAAEAGPPVVPDQPMTASAGTETVTVDSEAQIPSVETPKNLQDDQLRRTGSSGIPSRSELSEMSEIREETAADVARVREASSSVKLERQSMDIPAIGDKRTKRTINRIKLSGSVAMVRKQIVMDIVKQSGGVYPMGMALWYPFTTAWLKRQYKERPDMKTLRSTVGALVETGKLRQYTFTGRNSKGVMVTKSLIADAELEAGDQRITDLQTAMLNADLNYYFPPGVDVDETLRKSQTKTQRPQVQDTDVTVTLHQTPKRVYQREEMAARAIERKRAREEMNMGMRRQPIHRLNTLKHRQPHNKREEPPTRGPLLTVWRHQKRGLLHSWRSVSDGLSMIMEPQQVFNAATGTFGTIPHETKKPSYLTWSLTRPPFSPELPENRGGILSEAPRPGYSARPPADTSAEFFDEDGVVRQWGKRDDSLLSETDYTNYEIPRPLFPSAPLEEAPGFASSAFPPGSPAEPMATGDTTRGARANYRPLRIRQQQPAIRPAPKSAADRTAIVRRRRQPRAPSDIRDRLLIVIVVVRTLAGGLDARMIDWVIVASLFPEYTLEYVYDHGKSVMGRNRLQIAKMQDDFRESFAEAYERGEVPRIDFNNLESYDWEWVVNWAEEQLETPREWPVPSLPSTRAQFDNLFEIRAEPAQSIDEIYQQASTVTIPRRQALLSNTVFSIPIKSPAGERTSRARATDAEQLKVAKTWIRANVLTPEESYRSVEASETLRRFGSDVLDRAITSLVTERALLHSNRGRVAPGRNYNVTDHFLYILGRRRPIEPAQLKRAAHFKTDILDEKFRSEGKYVVEYGAEDGDILVVINLADEGRVILSPRDPPRKKFGLTEFGYQTRKIDKANLRFTVDVTPVEGAYVYGDPVRDAADHTPVPRGEMDLNQGSVSAYVSSPPPGKIPLWFDIHRQIMPEWWNAALCAVLGSLALRPGMDAEGIAKMLQPCLAGWDVDLVLEWLQKVDIAQRDSASGAGSGWMVKGWWWMVMK